MKSQKLIIFILFLIVNSCFAQADSIIDRTCSFGMFQTIYFSSDSAYQIKTILGGEVSSIDEGEWFVENDSIQLKPHGLCPGVQANTYVLMEKSVDTVSRVFVLNQDARWQNRGWLTLCLENGSEREMDIIRGDNIFDPDMTKGFRIFAWEWVSINLPTEFKKGDHLIVEIDIDAICLEKRLFDRTNMKLAVRDVYHNNLSISKY